MKYKLYITLLTSLLIFASLTSGQGDISLSSIEGLVDSTAISTGRHVIFTIHFTNNSTSNGAFTNGFRIYSPDGADWDYLVGDTLPLNWSSMFDLAFGIIPVRINGVDADTMGFGGSRMSSIGFPAWFDEDVFTLTIGPVPVTDGGKTICLDSCWFPNNGIWIWASPDETPTWDGPHCFTLRAGGEYDVTPSGNKADMYDVVTADLDRDNYGDIIYTGNKIDSLFIAFGNTEGTLDDPVGYYINIKGAAIDVNFVNRDTLLDIMVRTGSDLYLFVNDGYRNFTKNVISPASLLSPPDIANDSALPSISSGFFDSDYYLDMVISKNQILFGDGLGGFNSILTLGFQFDAVDVADFNYDGYDDLAVTFDDSAKIYVNDGTGNMIYSDGLIITNRPYDVTSIISGIDLNLDEKYDFITLASMSTDLNDTSMLTIVLGGGTGGILSSDTIPIYGSALNMSVSDVNRDGYLDIQVINQSTRNLEIFYTDGFGSIADTLSVDLGEGTDPLQALTNIDLDRNGSVDIIVGGDNESDISYVINDLPDEPILTDEMVTTGYDNVTVKVINPIGLVISQHLKTVASSDYWSLFADTINEILDVQAYDYNLQYGTYKIIFKRKPGVGDEAVCGIGIGVNGSQQQIAFKNYSVPPTGDSIVYYYDMEETSSVKPMSGFPTANPQPTLSWNSSSSLKAPTQYHVQIDRLYDFSTPFVDDSLVTDTNFTIPTHLGIDSVYYWRYREYDFGEWSEFSHPYSLYIVNFVCGDINVDGSPMDISDLLFLVDYMFLPPGEAPEPPIMGAANLDGVDQVDVSDLLLLVDYMFLPPGTVPIPTCFK